MGDGLHYGEEKPAPFEAEQDLDEWRRYLVGGLDVERKVRK